MLDGSDEKHSTTQDNRTGKDELLHCNEGMKMAHPENGRDKQKTQHQDGMNNISVSF
jgi:hypothetical protein